MASSIVVAIATSISLKGWYEWAVTELVKEQTGVDITFVCMFQTIIDGNEEQIVFTSKESTDESLRPTLVAETSVNDFLTNPIQQTTVIIAIVGAVSTAFLFYKGKKVVAKPK